MKQLALSFEGCLFMRIKSKKCLKTYNFNSRIDYGKS